METDYVNDSVLNLKVHDDEKSYVRQLNEVEAQEQYLSTQVPLADDESSIGLKRELNIEGGQKAKKNLMFEITNVSVFKLYFHLSETFEYFLMIMGFIGSIATGASNPIMAYLTGSTTSEASTSNSNNIDSMSEEQKKIFFEEFKDNMNDKVREFMIYGAASFVAAFMSII